MVPATQVKCSAALVHHLWSTRQNCVRLFVFNEILNFIYNVTAKRMERLSVCMRGRIIRQ